MLEEESERDLGGDHGVGKARNQGNKRMSRNETNIAFRLR